MNTPLFPHFYTGFFQIAYVTTDLQASMTLFAEHYGVRKFLETGTLISNVISDGKPVANELLLAFAGIGDQHIELIQPLSDGCGRYASALPETGFAQHFHHLGCRFTQREQWQEFRGNLDTQAHPIAFENADGSMHFLYTDERPRLGHYLEYMWLDDEGAALFDAIPQN
ncbi:MAG: hypothetical protein WC247_08315 [Porticoccaceae bacterium]